MSTPSEQTAPLSWTAALTVRPGTQEPLSDPTLAYLASLSPKGRQTMVERLRAVARALDVPDAAIRWHELRFQHVEFIRARLAERGVAPKTIKLTLTALRGIARYARNLNLMTAEEYDRIRDVKPAPSSRLPAGRAAKAGEVKALVDACLRDPTPAGVRDAAILAVLYIGGVRRSELAALEYGDWSADPPTLRVRHGKGDKERLVPLAGGAAAALSDWVTLRGDRPGGLFLPISRYGKLVGDAMTSHAVCGLQRAPEAPRPGRGAEAVAARLPAHLRRRSP